MDYLLVSVPSDAQPACLCAVAVHLLNWDICSDSSMRLYHVSHVVLRKCVGAFILFNVSFLVSIASYILNDSSVFFL